MGRGDQCEVADRTISGKFAELALTARTEVTAKLQCLMAVQGPASANGIKIDSQAQSTRRRGTGIRPSFAAGIPSEREMPLPSRRWPEAGYVRIRVRGSALRSEPRDNCLGRERGKVIESMSIQKIVEGRCTCGLFDELPTHVQLRAHSDY